MSLLPLRLPDQADKRFIHEFFALSQNWQTDDPFLPGWAALDLASVTQLGLQNQILLKSECSQWSLIYFVRLKACHLETIELEGGSMDSTEKFWKPRPSSSSQRALRCNKARNLSCARSSLNWRLISPRKCLVWFLVVSRESVKQANTFWKKLKLQTWHLSRPKQTNFSVDASHEIPEIEHVIKDF